MNSALELAAVVAGVCFMVVASLGVLRLPDFYARIHAPTKAATLGLEFLLTAFALHFSELTSVTKAVLAVVFIAATAPVGAHILSRAAHRSGLRAPGAIIDEYEPHARARAESHEGPAVGRDDD